MASETHSQCNVAPEAQLTAESASTGITSADGTLLSPTKEIGAKSLNLQSLTKVPAQTLAIVQTIKDYVDSFSHNDREPFRFAPDIVEKLWELQRSQSRICSIPGALTTRAQKVIRCMKSFVVSITSVIQPLPEICSLAVGGVNCVLTVSARTFSLLYRTYLL